MDTVQCQLIYSDVNTPQSYNHLTYLHH